MPSSREQAEEPGGWWVGRGEKSGPEAVPQQPEGGGSAPAPREPPASREQLWGAPLHGQLDRKLRPDES